MSSSSRLTITFGLVLLTMMLAGPAMGQGLSKSDVLRMQQEGVDKSILEKKINRDGINFQMTADVILELKNAQMANVVRQQNAAWYSIMTNESFAVIEPGLFRDFEELVGLI